MSAFHGRVPVRQSVPRRTRPASVAIALLVVLWFAVFSGVRAEVPLRISSSRSGQFVVSLARPSVRSRAPLNLETNANFVRLDPTLLPISCERLKEALWRELNVKGPWQGRIFLGLYPADSEVAPITLASERFRDGWQYRLEFPDILDRNRLVRAVVQALLLELANRTPSSQAAEIPMWLSEGLTRQMLASSPVEMILSPPKDAPSGLRLNATMSNTRLQDPLTEAHQQLAAVPPLTFEQLSWPDANAWTAGAAETFGCSAQLFVSRLLGLKDGPACLQQMLRELPLHYNWQLAFFQGFSAYFHDSRDVEKWWALQSVSFSGHDLAQTWPAAEGWQKLDEVVRSAVQVRVGTNDLPLHAEVKLQTILREWEGPRQTVILRNKVTELELLELRLTPKLRSLADAYCQTLRSYLQAREHPGFVLPLRKAAVERRAAEQVLQQLDALDAKRSELKPQTEQKPDLARTAN